MSMRELPDFLKSGDPALTWPHGKEYTPIHPKGRPRLPCPEDPRDAAEVAWREWERRIDLERVDESSFDFP